MKKFIKQYHECITLATLQSILILLKVFNKINWKWTYVLMPLWIFLAVCLTLIILAIIVGDRDRWN